MRVAQKKKRLWRLELLALTMIIVISYASPGQPAAARNLIQMVDEFTPAGWQIFGAAKQFGKENLWEQINGRASFFLAYDMVRMTFVSFVNSTNESQFIEPGPQSKWNRLFYAILKVSGSKPGWWNRRLSDISSR